MYTNHREERTYCSHGTEVKQWKVLTSEVVSKAQANKCCKTMNDRSCGRRTELELQERDVNAAPYEKKRACIQKHFFLLSDCRLIRIRVACSICIFFFRTKQT
jgi:hypothetical protein